MNGLFQLYVKQTSNYPPGFDLQTFERLGEEWTGESLALPFEVVGWCDLFTGRPCPVHVVKARCLPGDGNKYEVYAGGVLDRSPAQLSAAGYLSGFLVYGGNSGIRILDPDGEPTPGAEHLPPGRGLPVMWIEHAGDLPADVRAVVAPGETCERCGRELAPGTSPYHVSPGQAVFLCPDCASPGHDPDPDLCLGYLKLDRPGDLDPGEVACLECDGACEAGIWLAAMQTPAGVHYLTGPYCDLCAASE